MAIVMERQRSAQILLVEDNRGDALLTRRAFGRAKAPNEITVASTAEIGLSILRNEDEHAETQRPDIVLLDLNLPAMNGHDFLAAVKDDPKLRQIPVIILSSSNAGNDVTTSYRRHANGYITKPLTPGGYDEIVTKIEDYWFGLMQLPPDGQDQPGKRLS